MISLVLYFNPEWVHFDWLQVVSPVLVIFYGLFLLIKARKNSDEYLACSCSHEHENTKTKNPILVGILAGLTPCPSVFAPIMICLSQQNITEIFYYIIAYIFGVISVFVSLFIAVLIIKRSSTIHIENLVSKFNPHLISGVLMVIVGLFYLAMGLMHSN